MHDTRATFITIKLANGRTETWISDRTGHKSSRQIHHYKRAARKVAELGLGDFAPLDEAIPELRGMGGPVGGTLVLVGPDAGAASQGGSFCAAPSSQAPTPTDDAAGRSTAADAAAEGGPLGPRWATSEPPSTAKRPEATETVKLSGDRASPTGNSWRDL
ncbi:hypothetical protein [Sorangium sp. So ce1099]|uniref:hypothetical protein n=1 Tax=Sorangium sp. So ce1099 TaxID=3133331 RepID=UPI003F643660